MVEAIAGGNLTMEGYKYGFLPFSAIYIELYYIFSSVLGHMIYTILDCIVCVKPSLKKSLFNVFQNGNCNLNLALVIDDRLKVWDEKDQPRVHIVPAFAPYYAPQAEANKTVPVLCVSRNVACNVRGGFFKDFNEGILQIILEVKFDDDVKDILLPPDVSNYLISEDDASALNGNKDSLSFDGMSDIEVERRLKDETSASPVVLPIVTTADPRLVHHLLRGFQEVQANE